MIKEDRPDKAPPRHLQRVKNQNKCLNIRFDPDTSSLIHNYDAKKSFCIKA